MDIQLHEPQDADELKRLIRQARNAKQRDRLRAVALAIQGHPTLDIMRMLDRSRGFVQRWCYAYRDGGLSAVGAQSPPGRPTRLPASQHEAFARRVLAGPTESDSVCALRGRDMIRILHQEFGVRYTLSGVYELLQRLDLCVLTPRPRHRKQDPQAMTQWEADAPFLSAASSDAIPINASRCGSRTKHASDNKAR